MLDSLSASATIQHRARGEEGLSRIHAEVFLSAVPVQVHSPPRKPKMARRPLDGSARLPNGTAGRSRKPALPWNHKPAPAGHAPPSERSCEPWIMELDAGAYNRATRMQ
jgi:hypothetical protein